MDCSNSFRSKIETYATISEEEWIVVSEKLSFRTIKRNEPLIQIGEVSDKVWFNVKGVIRYVQRDRDYSERTTCLVLDDTFCTPFSSFINGTPSHEALIALEETSIVEIKKKDFMMLLDVVPAVKQMYIRVLEEAFLELENFTYFLQSLSAFERYEKLVLERTPEILQRVPLVHIASYLGMSPETLSRIRSKV